MINQVHTSCKDCAFSVYSDKTQTGCSAGMLDKYKDAGAEFIDRVSLFHTDHRNDVWRVKLPNQ